MQAPLTLDSLGELDNGSARLVINAAIAEAAHDVEDRGGDGKARKVVINLELKQLDNGLIVMNVEACASVPKRRTAATVGMAKRDGDRVRVLFQTLAPEDPAQRTIDEVEDARRKGKEA